MTTSNDNQLVTQASGTADWDSALNANFNTLERGHHIVAQAGVAINTSQVVWMNSGGFLFPFNALSLDVQPNFLTLLSAASGDSVLCLRSGIVRSFGVNSSAGLVGKAVYVDAKSPGIIVGSYSAASRRVGTKIGAWAIEFDPQPDYFPEKLTVVTTISAVVASNHLFSVDVGKRGWNRRVLIQGSSNLVTVKWHSGSTRAGSELLYETFSGGVTCIGSFIDQAGWPQENTEAGTLSGLMFGTLFVNSGSNVTTGDIGITVIHDRFF